MADDKIISVDNISQLNELLNQGKPKHPLISIIDFSKVDFQKNKQLLNANFSTAYYSILLKTLQSGSLKYGRQNYDFQEGSLFFMSPNQVFKLEHTDAIYGWGLVFHPDLIRGTSLGNKIKDYTFFNYAVNEALHLSDEEKSTISRIVNDIHKEINRPIDKHSKSVIVSGVELLLNYCLRFYDRQFITRTVANKDVLTVVEKFLLSYLRSDLPRQKGLPTVVQCAEAVNLSNNYLSDLLKKETGKSTQEHIHYFLIEEAKTKLLSSNNSVSEIAYGLGFEYPQYFSKLFKKKVGITPLEYRGMN